MLTSEASAFAIGVNLQQGPVGKDQLILYASRAPCVAENRNSIIERELLAIMWTVKQFLSYLFGRRFVLTLDHRLTNLVPLKKGSRKWTYRWRLKLEENNYKIKHKPGKINKNEDVLLKLSSPKNCKFFLENSSFCFKRDWWWTSHWI